jgi:UDP-N-acetylglucosamine:LPS N-acetylglucosamine transferase
MKVLAIASEGGHWVQLLRLTPAFKNQELSFMSTNPDISATLKDYTYYRVPDANQGTKLKLIRCFFQVAWVILKHRPKAIITTGAAPGLMGIIAGKLIGAKTIWVDSIANAEELSLSGKIAGYFADRVYTQWANLETKKIIFKGNVLS